MVDHTPYDPLAEPAAPRKRKPARKGAPAPVGDRLNKYLASAGFGSRRSVEALIVEGRVDVDGVIVTDLGRRVEPDKQVVRVDGERVRRTDETVVIVLNKPPGYLSAASDPEHRPLVYHLIPAGQSLKNIGRLDFNTEGVLLFTNDGGLAERLGHARYAVQRVYEARVRGIPSEDTLAKLRRGVRLEDGLARAESVEVVKVTDRNAWLRLTLLEGRNREVRRLLERVGHPVIRLRRVLFAGVASTGLQLGQWRQLTETEVEQLRSRGHVGKFELPPDPRRKGELPGLSTGPAPGERHTAVRRGAGRQAAGTTASQAPRPPAAAEPSRTRGPQGPSGASRDGTSRPASRDGTSGPASPRSGSPRSSAPRPVQPSGGTSRDSAPAGERPTRGGRPDRGSSRPKGPTDRPPRGNGGGASSRKPRREGR